MGHILEWFEQKYHLVHTEDRVPSHTEITHSSRGSAVFPTTAPLQDASLMGQGYDVTQGAQVDGAGQWPNFLWDISTEDILGGYMEFMDMPYPTLQSGFDMPLS